MRTEPIVQVCNVGKSYIGNGTHTKALEDVSFEVLHREFVCIIGESGCGKSTLLQMIAGFEAPTHGQVLAGGVRISGPDYKRGIVFQEPSLLPWLTVRKNISLGPDIRNQDYANDRKVEQLISLMGLSGFEQHYPAQLSGGMNQRVAIARALINDPDLLLLDEPFGALDSFTRMRLQLELLRIWEHQHLSTIFVTHDIDEAVFLATRVIVMSARPGRVARIFNIALRHPRDRSSPEFIRLRNMISKEFLTLTKES